MMRTLALTLLVLSFVAVDSAFAQAQEEDVVVLKDSTIIRGEITQTVTQGSAVTIKRGNGRVTSLLWSEILTIKRLPVSMPDSAIAALFLRSGSGGKVSGGGSPSVSGGYSSPFGVASRDTTEEDILILTGGKVVRGRIVESSMKGSVGLWTPDQNLSVYQDSEIQKKLHLAKGSTDSTINVMYINPLPEMIADDFRILTLFGGFSMAAGQFANPINDGGDPAGSGFAVGIHASLRIVPSIRWATTAIFARNSMDLPTLVSQYSATGGTEPHQLFWLVTGGELRTEGTSAMKGFICVEGGMLFSRITKFDFTIPLTFNHLGGSGGQEGSSSESFAICIGGGVSIGRFSLTGRYLTSSASYSYTTTIDYGPFYGGPRVYAFKYDQPVNVILVSLGFSPF
jgi:hypothetical protein